MNYKPRPVWDIIKDFRAVIGNADAKLDDLMLAVDEVENGDFQSMLSSDVSYIEDAISTLERAVNSVEETYKEYGN